MDTLFWWQNSLVLFAGPPGWHVYGADQPGKDWPGQHFCNDQWAAPGPAGHPQSAPCTAAQPGAYLSTEPSNCGRYASRIHPSGAVPQSCTYSLFDALLDEPTLYSLGENDHMTCL